MRERRGGEREAEAEAEAERQQVNGEAAVSDRHLPTLPATATTLQRRLPLRGVDRRGQISPSYLPISPHISTCHRAVSAGGAHAAV